MKPLESINTQPSVQILTCWAGWFVPGLHTYQPDLSLGCDMVRRWPNIRNMSNIQRFLTAPWISDNGSGWICTERKLWCVFYIVVKSYWKVLIILGEEIYSKGFCENWFCSCVANTLLLPLFKLWKTTIFVFDVTCSLIPQVHSLLLTQKARINIRSSQLAEKTLKHSTESEKKNNQMIILIYNLNKDPHNPPAELWPKQKSRMFVLFPNCTGKCNLHYLL